MSYSWGSKYVGRVGVFKDLETVKRFKLLNVLDDGYYYEVSTVSIILSV